MKDFAAAAMLRLVRVERQPLHIAAMRQRDHHRFFGDEGFAVIIAQLFIGDLGPALVAVLVLQRLHVLTDHGPDVGFIGEQPEIFTNVRQQLRVLVAQFFAFEIGREFAGFL